MIYENKNIIINDVTKNYGKDTNLSKTYHNKINTNVIYKMKNENNLNKPKFKFGRTNTESNGFNIKNNNILSVRESFKLNFDKEKDKRDFRDLSKSKTNRSNINHSKKKDLLKNSSSFNDKIKGCLEKKKIAKNIIIQNRIKKIGFGDSYEFNFTFNNFNSNFTYNNYNDSLLKDSGKKSNNLLIKEYSNENLINEYKSTNSSSVRNKIFGKILEKNKDISQDKIINNSKIEKRRVRKGLDLNKLDKNYCAIIIQKIFRGYYIRKNCKFNFINNYNNIINSNLGIYKKKRILSNKQGININNNDFINFNYNSNRNQKSNILKKFQNYSNINNENENKIQEIIIDRQKMLNVLNPTIKRNNIKEIKINNVNLKKTNSYNRHTYNSNLYNKCKLLKCLIYWNDMTIKKMIIERLIEYNKKKNELNNLGVNYKYQKNRNNNEYRYQRKGFFKNNNI